MIVTLPLEVYVQLYIVGKHALSATLVIYIYMYVALTILQLFLYAFFALLSVLLLNIVVLFHCVLELSR